MAEAYIVEALRTAGLVATLVHALRARGLRYGLQTMCEGGGIASATIMEAL